MSILTDCGNNCTATIPSNATIIGYRIQIFRPWVLLSVLATGSGGNKKAGKIPNIDHDDHALMVSRQPLAHFAICTSNGGTNVHRM
jgi:hypothetical protein